MRKLLTIMLSFMLLTFVVGCSDSKSEQVKSTSTKENKYVKLVKDSKNKFYNDVKYGDAFKYFFSKGQWEYYKGQRESETGEKVIKKANNDYCDVVQFTGEYTEDDIDTKVLIQFVIDTDKNDFEAAYLSFDDESQNILMIDRLIGNIFEEYEKKQKTSTSGRLGDEEVDLQAFAECMKSFTDPPSYAEKRFKEYYTEQYNTWKNKEGYYTIIQNKDGSFEHVDYNEKYADILDKYEMAYNNNEYYNAYYGIYDLDNNGTYELIVSYGESEADWANDVYEYTKSGIKYVGKIDGYLSFYQAENRDGIYGVYCNMGSQIIRRIRFDNGVLSDTIILEEDVGDDDYYSNDNPINMNDIDDRSQLQYMV